MYAKAITTHGCLPLLPLAWAYTHKYDTYIYRPNQAATGNFLGCFRATQASICLTLDREKDKLKM